jgi:penicillin-binding protein 1C
MIRDRKRRCDIATVSEFARSKPALSAEGAVRWRMPAFFQRFPTLSKLIAGALVLSGAWLLCEYWPRPRLMAEQHFSRAVLAADRSLLRLTLADDQRFRLFTPIEEIPEQLRRAVLLHEDQLFAWHLGFNPVSLVRGAFQSYVAGGRRQGGSTVTMQLVRLRERFNTRSPAGKLKQIAYAIWLEARYSKQEIFEAYLNLAPFGGNVEGVGAASWLYFGKPVGQLSLPEQLTLAVLPQSPARRMPADDSGLINPALKAARDRLFARLKAQQPELADAAPLFALPLAVRSLRARPFVAPHLVDAVLRQSALEGRDLASSASMRSSVPTNLEPKLQGLVEREISRYLRLSAAQGLDNAAAMLVDTRSMAIVAAIGSADYFSAAVQGQNNGLLAKRSPGSTLKPFIYALALDQGILHPATLLRDVPTAFGPFTPENYDGQFVGPLDATEALTRSRNIPAVWVAAQLRNPSLYQFLKSAGVSDLKSEQHYGLALVLGGGDLNMAELAQLYASLRNQGRLKPLRWRADDPELAGTSVLSPEAAYITELMLRSRLPPEVAQQAAHRYPLAWKTGTSFGFRDAWTAGLIGPYVLVVWLGHFDNRSNPSLIGIDAAAPLYFSIAQALVLHDPANARDEAKPSDRVRRIEVCAPSGGLPTRYCKKLKLTWFIPGKSPLTLDEVFRPVRFALDDGRALCPNEVAPFREEIVEHWSSDLLAVYSAAGMPKRPAPDLSRCALVKYAHGGQAPRLSSPRSGASYELTSQRPIIVLKADIDGDAERVHWFAGASYLGASAGGEALDWSPVVSGQYEIRAVDDHGRSTIRRVRVEIR